MTDFPESGVKLIVDTADALSAVSDLQSALDDVQSGSYTATVTTEVDNSGLDDLPLDGETVDFTVDVTQEGDTLPSDGETIDTTVNTEVTPSDSNSNEILGTLKSINAKQTFQMVLNIAGTAVDFFKGVAGFAVQPMLDLDNALARIKATTGETIPNADQLINKIFYSDLGDSIDQVAKLVGQAHQIKAPIDDAVTSTLQFTKVFTDQNPEQVLNTLNNLVVTGLEPNFQKAGDDLVRAFQNGANRGGDLLDTLNHNATAIHDLGLNAQDVMSIVSSGLAAGFTSADEVIKTLEKIKTNVTSAAGTSNKTADTLRILGIANPAETGKAWSADFFTSVIKGIQEAPVSDSEKMAMFQNLVGGKLSAKEFSSFMKLSPEDAAGIFENTKGAAATAAAAIDDSLQGAISDFERAAQGAAQDFLSSKQIDLPGKIAALKSGLQDGLTALQGGAGLGEALTIALKPIGFDDEFQGLESALGNFVIAILQAVSFLQSLDPSNWKAKAGTDSLITQMGQKQLAFDLKIANPDQVADDIQTAVSRGVSPEQIANTVGNTVDSLIAAGTPQLAKSLLDAVQQAQTDANTNVQLTSSGSLMNFEPTIPPEKIEALKQEVNDAVSNVQATVTVNANANPKSIVGALNEITGVQDVLKTSTDNNKQSITDMQNSVLGLTNATDDTKKSATEATKPVQTVADNTKKQGDNSAQAAPKVQTLANDTQHLANAADNVDLSGVTDAINAIGPDSQIAATGLIALDVAIGKIIAEAGRLASANDTAARNNANASKNTPTEHAWGATDASGTFIAGDDGPEIITTNKSLAVLNNMTTESIMAAMQSYIPGARGGGSSHVNNTINNYNVIPNEATADSLGYRQASVLRGMN